MLSSLANIEPYLAGWPSAGAGAWLLAQSGPSPSFQWAIVGFAVILGLLVTLSPSRRTFEIKRSKDE